MPAIAGHGKPAAIAIFDLDGTITRRDTFLAYLVFVLVRRPYRLPHCLGLLGAVARFGLGQLSRDELKRRCLTAVVGGCRRGAVARYSAIFADRCLARMVKQTALARIEWHRRQGHRLVLASAGLDLYVAAIAARLGFDEVICTRTAWTGDTVAGDFDGPNLRGDMKLAAVTAALTDALSPGARIVAYSDHDSDLPLLRFADQGIAVDPTLRLAAIAAVHGLAVESWRTRPARDVRADLRWTPGSAKFRLLAGILQLLFGVYGVAYVAVIAGSGAPHPFGDSFALWSWGRFAAGHPAAQIYDPATLHSAQVALGMDGKDYYPFGYPPSFLLALWPLGLLPYAAACAVGLAITLPLYLWATVGAGWRSPMTLAALLAPTTTIAIVSGQSGFLAAALLVGGLRLAPLRPILAGVLLGLLTYKPQIGILVPVALVSAGLWRTAASGVATALALGVVASVAFGGTIWPAWIAAVPAFASQFAAESSEITHLMPTVTANLLQLGVAPSQARLAQWIAAIAAAGVVWFCFRLGPTRLATAALLVATFLATPYAFVYDMPMLATAVLWVIAERDRSGASFGSGEVLILLLAMVFPITMPAGASLPLSVGALALLVAVIVRRIWRLRTGASVADPSAAAAVNIEVPAV